MASQSNVHMYWLAGGSRQFAASHHGRFSVSYLDPVAKTDTAEFLRAVFDILDRDE